MFMERTDILSQKEIVLRLVAEKVSKCEISRQLNCDIKTVDRYLEIFGVKYKGNQGWRKGHTYESKQYVPFNEYIKTCKINTNRLRNKLIREGLKLAKCERCGNTSWNGQPISLELHHKDGVRDNNELVNLEILCPNCHAQTSTYRGRNIKK
jgi:hypothetical protein